MIFARNIDSSLTSLVKKVDAATKENSSAKMGSFVVFLASDDDAKKMEVSLPEYAKKENIKSLVLAIDNVAGPQAYNIAKDVKSDTSSSKVEGRIVVHSPIPNKNSKIIGGTRVH